MSTDARPAHLHGLDGLRGVACIAVFVDHVEQYAEWLSMPHGYGPSLQALGRQGVELFFVLSGYLITYRMLREREATGRVSIPRFYLRRALRIWPLYYVAVFAVFQVVPWMVHHVAGPTVRDASGWYLDGIPGDGRLTWYLLLLPHIAYVTLPPVLCGTHLWSIGVEEQFYLLWPWLLRLAGRRPLAMFTIVVAASFALNDALFPWGESLRPWLGDDNLESMRMYADHAHVEAMAIGAFVAWAAVHERPALERLASDPWTRAFAYIALPLGWYFFRNWHTEIGPALIYAFALAALSHGPKSRFLDWAPIRAVGVRSYALYVVHPFALFVTGVVFDRAGWLEGPHARWPYVAFGFAASLGLAAAAYRFVEAPGLALKDRWGQARSSSSSASPA
jgi:peptidoglycan/LPS O-acetylase OafA/YrhL